MGALGAVTEGAQTSIAIQVTTADLVDDEALDTVQRELETPLPSEDDLPSFRPRKRGRVVFAALVGGAAAVVLASVALTRFASHADPPAARVPAQVQERAPEPPPAIPSPAPVPSPVAPVTNDAPNPSAPVVEAAVAGALEKTPAAVTVTVKAVPEAAVIFRAGKRLGAGVVEVSVERNVKQRLTALLDGYTPANVVLDGSRDSVTIVLKRWKPRAAPVPQSDSPYGDAPSADPAAATAPAATTPAPAATAAPPAATATAAEPTAPSSPE